MVKENLHPNAYLSKTRNIKLGLRARTLILNALEEHVVTAKAIANKAEIHYGVVLHHLRLLETEGIIQHSGGKPHVWALTGAGQKRLQNTS
jgi:predicted ArsR family transcriptional regulator